LPQPRDGRNVDDDQGKYDRLEFGSVLEGHNQRIDPRRFAVKAPNLA
jgi:hypothetical protein